MAEIWKLVPSKVGLYASSDGRIMREQKVTRMPNGGYRTYATGPTKGYLKASSKSATHSYYGAAFRDIGNIKVHAAVCEAFHGPKPFVGAVVIHLNENSLDNRAENLKWGTQKENLNMPHVKQYHRQLAFRHFKAQRRK